MAGKEGSETTHEALFRWLFWKNQQSHDNEELHHANTPPNELSSQHCRHSLQVAVHSTPNDRMDSTTRLARSELEWPAISFLCWNWILRWRFRRSSLPTQPDEFGVALLSFSDVEPFFDGTRLDWHALVLSC
ncbi:hypothetical protein BLNAU_23161 [Blattamonas nauphoetae]|uniref:Uncharacterized protein n=1 Tax=Blattamonas nauphoetae TaxID=2049346 RepID=A0ABQ9WR30_9EUKA|nr:hypothetical protein BLNAU_23161 [Blattamonas nauphoetae]